MHGALSGRVNDLKALITAAEQDASMWMPVVLALAEALGARSAQVYTPPYAGRPSMPFLIHNIDFSPIAHKLGTHGSKAPFLARAMERGLAPGVFSDREVFPFDELQRDDYYKELLAPFRWLDGLQIVLRAPTASEAGLVFAFYRFVGERPFGAEEQHLAQTLFPHLASAARNHFQAPLPDASPSAFRILDGFSTPCVVVAATGKCVHANSAAQRLLKQGGPLTLRAGLLSTSDGKAAKQIQEAIQRAAAACSDGEPEEILLTHDAGAPLLAIVAPLPNEDGGLRFEENACAAIYLIRVEEETQYVAQGRRAQLLFNLTSAEGEILSLFLAGRSLRDIAAERRTATVTVRTQLKSIMHKTHSRHQLDLLRFRRLAP